MLTRVQTQFYRTPHNLVVENVRFGFEPARRERVCSRFFGFCFSIERQILTGTEPDVRPSSERVHHNNNDHTPKDRRDSRRFRRDARSSGNRTVRRACVRAWLPGTRCPVVARKHPETSANRLNRHPLGDYGNIVRRRSSGPHRRR